MDKLEQDYWKAGGKDTTKSAKEFGYTPPGPTLKSLAQGDHVYRGMFVFVCSMAGTPDVSNRGITSEHDQLLLTGPGVPEETHTLDYSRVVVLERDGKLLRAIPLLEKEQGKKTVFSGTWIWNNKNFAKKINPYPVPIHDRIS
jgi:hypothetical protein